MTGEAGDSSSSPSWLLLLILFGLSGSSFMIASLSGGEDVSDAENTSFFFFNFKTLLPVLPVVLLINYKVGDVHVVPLPGTLVVRQVFPFDQVVIDPLLVHTSTQMN